MQGFAKAHWPPVGAANSLRASACLLIVVCGNPIAAKLRPVLAASPQVNAAADRVEKLYNGFAVGTDAAGNEGYNAAQAADAQLEQDFLASFQNLQRNAANQTAWDQEEGQLLSDSLKYAGDGTLDAAAMYWGEIHLHLPVLNPEDLRAQAQTMPVSDQPGEREFDAFMADYLATRFDTLNKLVSSYLSVSDDMDGRDVPLSLADLQAELRLDEVNRTLGRSKR